VTEVLLQRSRGITVAKVYRKLFTRWPDAERLARARESSIAAVIRPLGLTRRAATVKALANEVVRLGGVPNTLEALLALPGVGRYAAGATLAVAFGRAAPVVDAVTARVYRRYFGVQSDLPASADEQLWSLVDAATPRHAIRDWNWSVLDLAAMVCLPKVPRCAACPLAVHCALPASRVGGA
jgi:A/G-specific adenine glycosylase